MQKIVQIVQNYSMNNDKNNIVVSLCMVKLKLVTQMYLLLKIKQ